MPPGCSVERRTPTPRGVSKREVCPDPIEEKMFWVAPTPVVAPWWSADSPHLAVTGTAVKRCPAGAARLQCQTAHLQAPGCFQEKEFGLTRFDGWRVMNRVGVPSMHGTKHV